MPSLSTWLAGVLLTLGTITTWNPCAAAPPPAAPSWQAVPMPPELARDKVRDLKFGPKGDLYVSFDTEGLWHSPDGGKTWKSIQYNLPKLTAGGMLGFNKQGEALFTPSSAEQRGVYRLPVDGTRWLAARVDTTHMGGSHFPNRLVLNKAGDVICATSATQILRSTDSGQSFQHTGNKLAGAALFDLTVSPANADELAIGTETGPMWRSTDGGLNWIDIGKPGGGGDSRMLYNRHGQLFGGATHSALKLGWTLARWTEGTTWVRSDKGLPAGEDTRCSALSGSGWMFLGNSNVYLSKDDGQNWQLAGADFPAPMGTRIHVRCLAVGRDGVLYAGVANTGARTAASGVWRLPLAIPPARP